MATATVDHLASAREGAASVADAVKRVADEAVASLQRVAPALQGDFRFSGTPGGQFEIRGDGFGASGTVTVNGVQAHTREWGPNHIVGTLPAGAGSGEVIVHIDDKTTKRAQFKF